MELIIYGALVWWLYWLSNRSTHIAAGKKAYEQYADTWWITAQYAPQESAINFEACLAAQETSLNQNIQALETFLANNPPPPTASLT